MEELDTSTAEPAERRFTFDPHPTRVRVLLDGVVIADSRNVRMLRETRHAPVYYFPFEDVRREHLERTDHHTHCPFKGDASYWSVTAGDARAENAVWGYEEPFQVAAHIKGYVAFYDSLVDIRDEGDAGADGTGENRSPT